MPLAHKTTCPTCGSKNPPEAERCGTCTRALAIEGTPSQQAYVEVMYAQPVRDTERPEHWIRPAWIFAFLAVLLVWCNFQYIGWGPDWAVRPDLRVQRGDTWRTVTETRGYTISFPSDARVDLLQAPTGTASRVIAAVDDRWVTVRPATTGLTRPQRTHDVHAVAVAVGADAPEALTEAIAVAALEAAYPGVTLDDPQVDEVTTAAYGEQLVLDAGYTGGVGEEGEGQVRARFIQLDGRLYLIAAFGEGSLDQDLYARLVDGFRPDGVLEAPDRAR